MEERHDGVPPLGDASSDDPGPVAGAGGLPAEPRSGEGATDRVRIAAVEAAVAAGLAPSTGRRPDHVPGGEERGAPEGDVAPFNPLELPDWGDPPTGQVPRILLDLDDHAGGDGSVTRGPSWREHRSDWEQDLDLAFLVDEEPPPPARGSDSPAGVLVDDDFEVDDEAWASLLDERPPAADAVEEAPRDRRDRGEGRDSRPRHRAGGAARSGHASPRRASERRVALEGEGPAQRTRRSPVMATATGLVAGAIALACFLGGPVSSVALVAAVVTLAAGEAFGALRRSGREPATLLGLLAVPALVVGSYLRGPQAVPIVFGLAVLLGFCWYLLDALSASGARHPVENLGSTMLVVAWIGVLGSFAGLLLDPTAYPHRHGVALLVGAVALTVAADVGAYATGSLVGRHRLARQISPNKSWEGFVGGTALTLVVAGAAVARIHPFTLAHALALGAVVAVVAPVGDLAESLVKRDLKVKDMGSLLPAHGGVLDRVDAMLFVLPATYYLARLVHLG